MSEGVREGVREGNYTYLDNDFVLELVGGRHDRIGGVHRMDQQHLCTGERWGRGGGGGERGGERGGRGGGGGERGGEGGRGRGRGREGETQHCKYCI